MNGNNVGAAGGTAVNEAVELAAAAFESSLSASRAERVSWMRAVADVIDAHADELVTLGHEETHLPTGRLSGELTRTTFQLRFLANEAATGVPLRATIDHADAAWPMGPRPDLRQMRIPIGVVAVFGASNFPLAFSVLGGDTASAWAAGCPVVHKIHPAHPRLGRLTADLATQALKAAGAPDGWLSTIDEQDAGAELVAHPLVAAVGFTGSTAAGLALARQAATRPVPIPFFGELGSTNPVFVTPQAWSDRRESIVKGFINSVTLGMGQFCTKPGWIFVPTGDTDWLRETIAASLEQVGRHELLSTRLRHGFESSTDEFADHENVDTLAAVPATDDFPGLTVFTAPLSLLEDDPTIIDHEMFGPATVLIEYERPEQLHRIARNLNGQLTAGIHTSEGDNVADLVALLQRRVGRVVFNDWPTGVTVSFAQNHGGPFPATTAPATTSVGSAAIARFMRPVAFQNATPDALPLELHDNNPLGVPQRVDGHNGVQE